MPIYEYRCKKCNDQIEVFQKLSDKPPTKCRKCGGRMEKQFSRTSVQFKGEGWYVTDYGRKGSVEEKVEKELSSPEPAKTDTSKPSETTKPKKPTSKNTGSNKS
jgi:putative FmdB family regulatory protein